MTNTSNHRKDKRPCLQSVAVALGGRIFSRANAMVFRRVGRIVGKDGDATLFHNRVASPFFSLAQKSNCALSLINRADMIDNGSRNVDRGDVDGAE